MDDPTEQGAALEALARLIDEAETVVAFTGAGISTESGIPDFRSPGGLWTRYKPIDYRDFVSSEEARRETWRRKFAMEKEIGAVEPNAAAGDEAVSRDMAVGVLAAGELPAAAPARPRGRPGGVPPAYSTSHRFMSASRRVTVLPSSRMAVSARPSRLTTFPINCRRSLPLSSDAVFFHKEHTSTFDFSVNSSSLKF